MDSFPENIMDSKDDPNNPFYIPTEELAGSYYDDLFDKQEQFDLFEEEDNEK